jgi:hypothetical protein
VGRTAAGRGEAVESIQDGGRHPSGACGEPKSPGVGGRLGHVVVRRGGHLTSTGTARAGVPWDSACAARACHGSAKRARSVGHGIQHSG